MILSTRGSRLVVGHTTGYSTPIYLSMATPAYTTGLMLIYSNFSGSETLTTRLYASGRQEWYFRGPSGTADGKINYLQPSGSNAAIILSNGTEGMRSDVAQINTGGIRIGGGVTTSPPTKYLKIGDNLGVVLDHLVGTYGSGSAYVCVYNNGTLFASDSACP